MLTIYPLVARRRHCINPSRLRVRTLCKYFCITLLLLISQLFPFILHCLFSTDLMILLRESHFVSTMFFLTDYSPSTRSSSPLSPAHHSTLCQPIIITSPPLHESVSCHCIESLDPSRTKISSAASADHGGQSCQQEN